MAKAYAESCLIYGLGLVHGLAVGGDGREVDAVLRAVVLDLAGEDDFGTALDGPVSKSPLSARTVCPRCRARSQRASTPVR